MKTIQGILPIGVVFDGKTHTTFTLRNQTLRDSRDAIREVGKEDDVELMAEIYRLRLLNIGDIPPNKITTDMILDLDQIDVEALEKSAVELKKKMLDGSTTDAGLGKGDIMSSENGDSV